MKYEKMVFNMIIFISCAIIFAVLVGLTVYFYKKHTKEKLAWFEDDSISWLICGTASLAVGITIVVLAVTAIFQNTFIESKHMEHIYYREALIYSLDNMLELKDTIQECANFNSYITFVELYKDDPLIGWYVDKSRVGVDKIDLSTIENTGRLL